MIKPEVLYFEDDGITPNNLLPVILYRDVHRNYRVGPELSLFNIFKSNNWTNNWVDIVMNENHYHSTTHEVIGIKAGEIKLVLGGHDGKGSVKNRGCYNNPCRRRSLLIK